MGTESARRADEWNGPFDPESYRIAREVLEQDRLRARGQVRDELRKRRRIVIVLAAVLLAATVALPLADPNLLLVAEVGWVALVIFGVFYLLPAAFGKGNLEEAFDQYMEQLNKLERAEIALPTPSCMEDLVAAIDLVSPPETE